MNWKRLCVAVLLTVCMAAAAWAAGGKDASTAAAASARSADIVNASGYPIVKQPITMSIATERPPNGGPEEDKWFWPFCEAYFGIKFDVQQIDQGAREEVKNIMFATGEVPELFLHVGFGNDQIMEFGMNQKFFVPLADLVDRWAPNIKKAFAEYPELLPLITTPDGKYYTLPGIRTENFLSEQRAFINTRWLDNLGLAMPKTLDEFHAVMKAFKERDPNGTGKADTIPFAGSWSQGFIEEAVIISAFGFVTSGARGMGLKDDKAVFIPYHPLFKEFLAYMNKLWKDGLMDPDMFTQTEVQVRAKSAQNLAGFQMDGAPFVITPNAWLDWESPLPLTSAWSSTPVYRRQFTTTSTRFFMTVKAKYPEAAIRFADWFFTPEGFNLFWGGPPIGSKEAQMGNLQYGWKIDAQGYRENVFPPGLSDTWNTINRVLSPIAGFPLGVIPSSAVNNKFNEERFGLKVAPVVPPRSMGAYEVEEPKRGLLVRLNAADRQLVLASYIKEENLYKIRTDLTDAQVAALGGMYKANGLLVTLADGSEQFLLNREGWWRHSLNQRLDKVAKFGYPPVFLTAAQLERTRELATPINDLVTQMTAKFITGVEQLDNFDAYRAELRKFGVEEFEKIYADAYEVYRRSLK